MRLSTFRSFLRDVHFVLVAIFCPGAFALLRHQSISLRTEGVQDCFRVGELPGAFGRGTIEGQLLLR